MVHVGLGLWGTRGSSGWSGRMVERVRESSGVTCSGRVAAASFKQVMEIFLQMHVCLPTSFPPSRGVSKCWRG
jgi:hypothetical protein